MDEIVPDEAVTTSARVTVRLVYLARLRDAFGRSGEAFPVADGATVGDVLDALRAREGAWAVELAPGRAVRVAVNHALAPPHMRLAANDEMALLPPVTGG
jgi:molybdopterin synthase sulfur carrier subunit